MNFQIKGFRNRLMLLVVSVCLFIGCLLLLSETGFSQSGTEGGSPRVTGITSGRARAIGGALLGLVSVIMGWRARRGKGNNRLLAIIALILGGITIIVSVIHLYTSAGAVFGSGSGKAGAIVALVLGIAGSASGGMALRVEKKKF